MQQKSKYIIIFLSLVIIVSGFTFWYYTIYSQDLKKWYDYVPEDALLVWENSPMQIDTQAAWCNIPVFKQINENLKFTEQYFLSDTTIAMPQVNGYSLHFTQKGSADFIGYLTFEDETTARNIFQKWQQKKYTNTILTKKERIYQEKEIVEIEAIQQKKNISVTQTANIIFFSTSATLIENVIRKKTINNSVSITKKQVPTASLNDSTTKIYINGQRLHELLNVPFLIYYPTNFINQFFKTIYLEVNETKQDILMNGFSVEQAPIFEGIKQDESAGFSLKSFVSQQTQWLLHVSFKKQLPKLLEYIAKNNKNQLTTLIEHSGKEAYLAQINESEYVLAIQLKNTTPVKAWLKQYTTQQVKFGKYTLHSSQENIGEMLAGKHLFEQTWYEIVDNTLLLANGKEALKTVIDDVAKEAVWAKSVRYQELTAQIIPSAHISFMLNTHLFKSNIENRLTNKWKNFMTNKAYDNFTFMSAQWKFQKDGIYTNLTVRQKSKEELEQENDIKTIRQNFFQHLLSTHFAITSNHLDQSKEMIVQDQQQLVYLIAANGKYVMTYLAEQPVIQAPQTVDWFNNGKYQYVLTTPEKLYVIDRNGEEVRPTPIKLPSQEQVIAFSNIIDYENNKDYRILLADTDGNLYLFDKSGKNLAGWTPRYIRSALAMPPFHLRVAGKDYMIAVSQKGIIHVLNRKGENYPKFSLDLKAPITSEIAVKTGGTPQETFFTLLTTQNELITINLLGNITKKNRLKPEKQYVLAANKAGNNFIIAATSAQEIAFFNENLQEICKLSGNYKNAQVGCYGFQQETFFTVFLPESKEVQLINSNGKLLHLQNIKADALPALLYNSVKKEITLYVTFERKASVLQLTLP